MSIILTTAKCRGDLWSSVRQRSFIGIISPYKKYPAAETAEKRKKNMDSAEELPGVKKKSFSMYYGGGEIWFEHLDGIYEHTALALKKLEEDYPQFRKPSKPSLIAINLDETVVDGALIAAIKEKLIDGDKLFTRVVFVGVDNFTKRKIKAALAKRTFALNFINDFEKAKEWLVSEGR